MMGKLSQKRWVSRGVNFHEGNEFHERFHDEYGFHDGNSF